MNPSSTVVCKHNYNSTSVTIKGNHIRMERGKQHHYRRNLESAPISFKKKQKEKKNHSGIPIFYNYQPITCYIYHNLSQHKCWTLQLRIAQLTNFGTGSATHSFNKYLLCQYVRICLSLEVCSSEIEFPTPCVQ